MKPEAQYSGFIERFQSYSKEYSTLKDATYAALKDAILLNMFPSEITETEISALLHISRTPIREAMLQLSNDGLFIQSAKTSTIFTNTTLVSIPKLPVQAGISGS